MLYIPFQQYLDAVTSCAKDSSIPIFGILTVRPIFSESWRAYEACSGNSQHLQYLDAIKSSPKDLSLPIFGTLIGAPVFSGSSCSYETGSSNSRSHSISVLLHNTHKRFTSKVVILDLQRVLWIAFQVSLNPEFICRLEINHDLKPLYISDHGSNTNLVQDFTPP